MSALPPKADICSAQADVCFVPIADILPLRAMSASQNGHSGFEDMPVVTRRNEAATRLIGSTLSAAKGAAVLFEYPLVEV